MADDLFGSVDINNEIAALAQAMRSGTMSLLALESAKARLQNLYAQQGMSGEASLRAVDQLVGHFYVAPTDERPPPQVESGSPQPQEGTGTGLGDIQGPAGGGVVPFGSLAEEIAPFAAFQRGLVGAGLPTGIGSGLSGSFLQNRFDPASATFLASQALSGGLEGASSLGQQPFEQFISGGLGGLGAEASSAFQDFLNLARGGTGVADPTFQQQQFLNPRENEEFLTAANLAREAIRSRIGGFAASRLLPRAADLQSAFLASPGATTQNAFLPFLQRTLGF